YQSHGIPESPDPVIILSISKNEPFGIVGTKDGMREIRRDEIDQDAQQQVEGNGLGHQGLYRMDPSGTQVLRHQGRNGGLGLGHDPDDSRQERTHDPGRSQRLYRILLHISNNGNICQGNKRFSYSRYNGRYRNPVDLLKGYFFLQPINFS